MKRVGRLLAIALLLSCACATQAMAHALAPALLEMTEMAAGRYDVLWRLSAIQGAGSAPQPELPAACPALGPARLTAENGAAVSSRWQVDCGADGPAGLSGKTLAVRGLENSGINVIVRIQDMTGQTRQTLLDAAHPTYTVPSAGQTMPVFPRYLALGAEHLWLGPDHLLFILGLMLLVRRPGRIILTLTAFTLGHSVTLSLAALGVIAVDQGLMEFGIAVSLLVLARELLSKKPSILGRYPGAMACGFGLLHGLGFAGALAETGLPQQAIVPALLAFNLGIELGQVAVVAVSLLAVRLWQSLPGRQSAILNGQAALPAYVIGAMAALWCYERMDALQMFFRNIV